MASVRPVPPARKESKPKFNLRERLPFWNVLEYRLFRGVLAGVNALPFSVSSWIAQSTGLLLYYSMPKRRKITLDNLDRAFGTTKSREEKLAIAKASFGHLATSIMEFFRIPRTLKEASRRFAFTGTEHLDRTFGRGRGVLLVISHFGSWEYLAFLPNLRKYPFSVVARLTKNPLITQWMQSMRTATTLKNIDKKNAIRPVLQELKQNHGVAILIDQWAGRDGLWLNFFGAPTSTTSIPARLAMKTGAALVPAFCVRTGAGNYRIEIHEEVPVAEGAAEKAEEITTQQLNDLLEARIRQNPEQWIWTHRRWKEKT
ncbi:MAG: lysophospholipid acyltransferase family protein [Candidatus Omnitrophica bacterium]|nr:lysophospholipid acyltransferase family protein [Candidatus Omnitrophota bacterium]